MNLDTKRTQYEVLKKYISFPKEKFSRGKGHTGKYHLAPIWTRPAPTSHLTLKRSSPFWATGSSQPNEGLGHHKLHIYPPLSTDILYYKPEMSANTILMGSPCISFSIFICKKKIKIKKITPILQTFTFLLVTVVAFIQILLGSNKLHFTV